MEKSLILLKEVNNFMQDNNISGTIFYRGESAQLVRCAGSQVSLNNFQQSSLFTITVQWEKRRIIGSSSAHDYDSLVKLVCDLTSKVALMPAIDFLTELSILEKISGCKSSILENSNSNIDTEKMVDFFRQSSKRYSDLEISGLFSSGSYSYAVINTMSEEPLFYQGVDYSVELVLQLFRDGKKELRGETVGEKLDDFDPANLFNSLDRNLEIKRTFPQVSLSSGQYDVIFSAEALAEIVDYMSYLTFCGESFEYQTGMLKTGKHKIGSKIFADNITIFDNPEDSETTFARQVGMNGIIRYNFPLVTNGVLNNLYYSSKVDADRFQKRVNNDMSVSSLKMLGGSGPNTFNEVVAAASSEKTILISKLHYTNFTNPGKGEFTSTTRFGTFLLEKGQVVGSLVNMRLNDSFFNIFNQIEWLSSENIDVNTSNSYGFRLAASISCPRFALVKGVKLNYV